MNILNFDDFINEKLNVNPVTKERLNGLKGYIPPNRFKNEKEKIAFLESKEDEINQVIDEIKTRFEKHIETNSWISGSSTEVYPIMVDRSCIRVQVLTSDKRIFSQNALNKIVDKYKDLLDYAILSKSDGSCPNELRFYFYR